MRQLAGLFPETEYPDVLVGLGEPDDAAIYRLDDERALIKTTDFFTPIVDDPWTYGAIAAANAMSDVYAMGGEVLFCLNIAGFPEDLGYEIIAQIFAGGATKVREAGAAIAGGHTVTNRAHPIFIRIGRAHATLPTGEVRRGQGGKAGFGDDEAGTGRYRVQIIGYQGAVPGCHGLTLRDASGAPAKGEAAGGLDNFNAAGHLAKLVPGHVHGGARC